MTNDSVNLAQIIIINFRWTQTAQKIGNSPLTYMPGFAMAKNYYCLAKFKAFGSPIISGKILLPRQTTKPNL